MKLTDNNFGISELKYVLFNLTIIRFYSNKNIHKPAPNIFLNDQITKHSNTSAVIYVFSYAQTLQSVSYKQRCIGGVALLS
jgi:hypothetical protein